MQVAVPAMTPNQAADLATHVPTTLGSILVSPETEKDEAFPQELAVPEVSLDKGQICRIHRHLLFLLPIWLCLFSLLASGQTWIGSVNVSTTTTTATVTWTTAVPSDSQVKYGVTYQ
jgi:hypothetical protein